MFEQERFSYDLARSARAEQFREGHEQMDRQEEEIAHESETILQANLHKTAPRRRYMPNLPIRHPQLFALGGYIGSRNSASSHFPTNCGIIRPMNQAMLIEVLRTYDAALRENGATGLFIFGSRATGVPRSDSDLDLFIDYDPVMKVPNIFRLMQIEEDISKALGIPVTITTRNALHPLMKKSIERDAIRVS